MDSDDNDDVNYDMLGVIMMMMMMMMIAMLICQ